MKKRKTNKNFVLIFILTIVSFGLFNDSVHAAPSTSVTISSGIDWIDSRSIDASTRVQVIMSNRGSDNIVWFLVKDANTAASTPRVLRPGEGLNLTLTGLDNKQHRLRMVCQNGTSCLGTGYIEAK